MILDVAGDFDVTWYEPARLKYARIHDRSYTMAWAIPRQRWLRLQEGITPFVSNGSLEVIHVARKRSWIKVTEDNVGEAAAYLRRIADEHNAIHYTPNGIAYRLSDQFILDEAAREPYARLGIQPGDQVLDLGAHIGTFARYAAGLGAQVTCVEAHPESFKLLKRNTSGLRLVQGAISTDHIYEYGQPYLAGVKRGRTEGELAYRIDVPEVDVTRERPDLVKIDIEGAEWDLLDRWPDLGGARAAAIEFHYRTVSEETQRRVYTKLRKLWKTDNWPAPHGWSGWGTLLFLTRL